MLRYIGRPIADIGVATIAAFCGKTDPSSVTEKDLAKTAKFLKHEIVQFLRGEGAPHES